jgi:hypothetical protein
MQFSAGLPGASRKDKRTTEEVKAEKSLGKDAGKWTASLYPPEALEAISSKIGEAREYHYKVTLPFVSSDDSEPSGEDDKKTKRKTSGIGILPAALIQEYGDKMRQFKGEIEALVESTFLSDPQKWIDWAISQHNGTFDPKNYPGCSREAGQIVFDPLIFREKMKPKFYLRTEPLPVPDAQHFSETVASLLGTDTQAVNIRVQDAAIEAQRELIKRMIAPVEAMAKKLSEVPKGKQSDIVFRDTLIGNIAEMVQLARKLNLTGDAAIDGFIKEMEVLTQYKPDDLRDDKGKRSEAANKAAEIAKRLSGYTL